MATLLNRWYNNTCSDSNISYNLFSQVYILKKDEGGRHTPFVTNYTPQMFVRTGDVAATVTLPEGSEFVMPGDNAQLTIKLMFDMPIETGLHFTLREGGRTVGTGVVTEILE